MRKVFFNCLVKLAKKDKRIYFLTGDLGYPYTEEFRKKFPKRFINCGIIEQTMMGIAAGLALSGKKPYVYSIIPFAIMRCFEQVRDDVCHQNLDVKIIGIGSKHYDILGFTHNITKNEDLKILKPLPNIECYVPKTKEEVEKIIMKTYKNKKPTYIRLV